MADIRDTNIRGFRLHAAEIKMLTYADDVAFFFEDRQSVLKAVCLTRSFSRYMGAQINLEKSVGIRYGNGLDINKFRWYGVDNSAFMVYKGGP